MNYKTPWLAVNLSMLFPGLGQIYAGEKFKGLILIFLEIILILIAFWSLLSSYGNTIIGWSLLLLSIIVYIINLFDTHFCMKKIMGDELIENIPRKNKDAWYAVCLNQIFPGVGHIYIKQITLGFMIIIPTLILIIIGRFYSNILIFYPLISLVACYHVFIKFPQKEKLFYSQFLPLVVLGILIFRLTIVYVPIVIINQIELFFIPSSSMTPTLLIGDRILVKKTANYQPKRGDLIVFIEPAKARELALEPINSTHFFIKRVIGLPGERIKIENSIVYINEQPLTENYILEQILYDLAPKIVPENEYFVLGDNRNQSFDSHVWGFLENGYIVGKAYKIYLPANRIRSLL